MRWLLFYTDDSSDIVGRTESCAMASGGKAADWVGVPLVYDDPVEEASSIHQALRFCGFCCSGSVTLIKKGESKKKL